MEVHARYREKERTLGREVPGWLSVNDLANRPPRICVDRGEMGDGREGVARVLRNYTHIRARSTRRVETDFARPHPFSRSRERKRTIYSPLPDATCVHDGTEQFVCTPSNNYGTNNDNENDQ